MKLVPRFCVPKTLQRSPVGVATAWQRFALPRRRPPPFQTYKGPVPLSMMRYMFDMLGLDVGRLLPGSHNKTYAPFTYHGRPLHGLVGMRDILFVSIDVGGMSNEQTSTSFNPDLPFRVGFTLLDTRDMFAALHSHDEPRVDAESLLKTYHYYVNGVKPTTELDTTTVLKGTRFELAAWLQSLTDKRCCILVGHGLSLEHDVLAKIQCHTIFSHAIDTLLLCQVSLQRAETFKQPGLAQMIGLRPDRGCPWWFYDHASSTDSRLHLRTLTALTAMGIMRYANMENGTPISVTVAAPSQWDMERLKDLLLIEPKKLPDVWKALWPLITLLYEISNPRALGEISEDAAAVTETEPPPAETVQSTTEIRPPAPNVQFVEWVKTTGSEILRRFKIRGLAVEMVLLKLWLEETKATVHMWHVLRKWLNDAIAQPRLSKQAQSYRNLLWNIAGKADKAAALGVAPCIFRIRETVDNEVEKMTAEMEDLKGSRELRPSQWRAWLEKLIALDSHMWKNLDEILADARNRMSNFTDKGPENEPHESETRGSAEDLVYIEHQIAKRSRSWSLALSSLRDIKQRLRTVEGSDFGLDDEMWQSQRGMVRAEDLNFMAAVRSHLSEVRDDFEVHTKAEKEALDLASDQKKPKLYTRASERSEERQPLWSMRNLFQPANIGEEIKTEGIQEATKATIADSDPPSPQSAPMKKDSLPKKHVDWIMGPKKRWALIPDQGEQEQARSGCGDETDATLAFANDQRSTSTEASEQQLSGPPSSMHTVGLDEQPTTSSQPPPAWPISSAPEAPEAPEDAVEDVATPPTDSQPTSSGLLSSHPNEKSSRLSESSTPQYSQIPTSMLKKRSQTRQKPDSRSGPSAVANPTPRTRQHPNPSSRSFVLENLAQVLKSKKWSQPLRLPEDSSHSLTAANASLTNPSSPMRANTSPKADHDHDPNSIRLSVFLQPSPFPAVKSKYLAPPPFTRPNRSSTTNTPSSSPRFEKTPPDSLAFRATGAGPLPGKPPFSPAHAALSVREFIMGTSAPLPTSKTWARKTMPHHPLMPKKEWESDKSAASRAK